MPRTVAQASTQNNEVKTSKAKKRGAQSPAHSLTLTPSKRQRVTDAAQTNLEEGGESWSFFSNSETKPPKVHSTRSEDNKKRVFLNNSFKNATSDHTSSKESVLPNGLKAGPPEETWGDDTDAYVRSVTAKVPEEVITDKNQTIGEPRRTSLDATEETCRMPPSGIAGSITS